MGEKWFAGKVSVPDEGFTHGGKFHADDVFATAFLRLLNPDIKITRGFEVPPSFSGVVYDIGRGRFDHHQEDREIRSNGCPYAAFGLLWREYAPDCVGEEEAKRFDESFVQSLDESDNTGCPNVLADVIDEFNPVWDSEESYDECFQRAVDFGKQILQNHFESIAGIKRAESLVRQAMQECDGKILVLPAYVPWKNIVVGSGYQLVVYPSNRGGYSVQGVPVQPGSNELVCALPEEWRGKDASELPEISGIATLRFCHASGFMAAAETKEDAILAGKKALKASLQ
ncbi:MAG: MYG1 family protein [Lachnospiraceae bacterium]|nr:MYG1 family protein [Lachnospiraceae bacterium]